MRQGSVLYICVSRRRGTTKTLVPRAVLRADHGLEGDAHAGAWHRQVSLLDEADIEAMRARGLEPEPGAFGENLMTSGLDLGDLGVGTCLQAGQAVLEITQVGKVCHNCCPIPSRGGDCLIPRAGLFARVLTGGEITAGMPIEVTLQVPRHVIQAAVLTVSDRCAAGTAEDTAGPAVADLLKRRLEAHVAWAGVVADEQELISRTMKDLAGRGLDLLATAGGTGCAPRDVTPEATSGVITREVPGLAEAMRAASARTTPHALLQRGLCGICDSTLILNLPGSKRAAVQNLTAVLPALAHAVQLLRGQTGHPSTDSAGDTETPPSSPRVD
jgi:molybdenum cofactor synthesis domain-containing protein